MTRRGGWSVVAAAALLFGVGVARPVRAAEPSAFKRAYSFVQVRVSLPGTQIGLSQPISGGENRFIGGAAIGGYQHGRVLGELSLGFWQRGADHALRAGVIPLRWDSRVPDKDGAPRGFLLQLELLGGYRRLLSPYSPTINRLDGLAALDLVWFAGGDGVGLATRLGAGASYAPDDVYRFQVILNGTLSFGVVF